MLMSVCLSACLDVGLDGQTPTTRMTIPSGSGILLTPAEPPTSWLVVLTSYRLSASSFPLQGT